MIGRIVRVLLLAGVLLLSSSSLPAQERWVYRYNGPADSSDAPHSLVWGSDCNLYVAGYSHGIGTLGDFTVVSLTDSGGERWVYRYDGPESSWDQANSIVMGSEGNLYVAGRSRGSGTNYDFTVISLSASGAERWVYRYDGPGGFLDEAHSIVFGSDGNLYAAGCSYGIGTFDDLTVVSLDTSGTERWVYRYDGPGTHWDLANSIVMGPNGNLHAAGRSSGDGSHVDFTVVSLTDSGEERWVYRYDGSGSSWDQANSIVVGSDGNLYLAGMSYGSGSSDDFTVISLTAMGTERWVYQYNGPGNERDEAFSIAMGPDGNLYAAGFSAGVGTNHDFTVISLNPLGTERWVYRYQEDATGDEGAFSVVTGSDGNIYTAGEIWRDETASDFMLVSLDASGAERWVYRYNGPANGWDRATLLSMGPDGNLYAAGYSVGHGTYDDITVVSLNPDVGVEEEGARLRVSHGSLRLFQNSPNPFHHSTLISYSISATTHATLSIYDITGRLVETLVNETKQSGIHQVRWDRKTNPSGVYFYRLDAGEFVKTRKMVVVE